jgi:uncharacterized protein
MRLSGKQARVVKEAIRKRDSEARIYLFGSRTDDLGRGGDIDLLVLSDQIGFRDEMRIRREILDTIGWQKLDLIVEKTLGPVRPIAEIALASGVEL